MSSARLAAAVVFLLLPLLALVVGALALRDTFANLALQIAALTWLGVGLVFYAVLNSSEA